MGPAIGNVARRGVFPLVSVVTFSLEFTVTVFAGIALSEEEGVSKSYTNTSIAAVSFSGLSVMSILALSTIHVSRLRYPWLYHGLLPLTGAAFGLIGAVLALNALLIERTNAAYFATARAFRVSTSTRIALWAVAGCFQLAFYTMLAFMRSPMEDSAAVRSSGIGLAEKKRQPPRPPTPPTPLRIVAPPFALPQASKPELPPSPKRNSWRDTLSSSLHQVVRPTNSRSRLLDRQMTVKTTTTSTTRTTTARSSMSRDSQSLSETKSLANSDDFPWDLHLPPSSSGGGSSPETQIHDMLASASPVTAPGQVLLPPMPHPLPTRTKPLIAATLLEPIPGSRPVSPAKALDMYTDGAPAAAAVDHVDDFNFGVERADTPASMATIRPPTSQSMASTIVPASSAPRRLSRSSRPSTPSLVSTSSISLPFAESAAPFAPGAADEAHIHPLFRSDSPTPPPVASPGTIVTASPLSGQVLPQAGRAGGGRSASPRPSLASTRRTPSRASSRLGTSSTPDGDDGAAFAAVGGGGVSRSATRSTRSASSASLARGAGLDAGPIPAFVLEAKRERII